MGKVKESVKESAIRNLVTMVDHMENYEFEEAVIKAAKRCGVTYGALRNEVVNMWEKLNG